MKSNFRKPFAWTTVILLMCAIVLIPAFSVAAAGSVFIEKAYGYGIYNCYVNAKKDTSTYTIVQSLDFQEMARFRNYKDAILSNRSSFDAATIGDEKVDCRKLLTKGDEKLFGGVDGVYQDNKGQLNNSERNTVLAALGYDSSDAIQCIYFYTHTFMDYGTREGDNYYSSNTVCGPKDGDLNRDNVYILDGDSASPIYFFPDSNGTGLTFENNYYTASNGTVVDDGHLGMTLTFDSINSSRNKGMRGMYQKIKDEFVGYVRDGYYEREGVIGYDENYSSITGYAIPLASGRTLYLTNNVTDTLKTYNTYTYGFENRANTSFKVINSAFGLNFSNVNHLKMSDIDRGDLYTYYVKNFYEAEKFCPDGTDQSEIIANNAISQGAIARDDSNGNTCYVRATKNKIKDVYVDNDSTRLFDGTKTVKFDELVNNSLTNIDAIGTFDGYSEYTTPDAQADVETGNGSADDRCWNSGIDSMAWILCPAESNLKGFASGVSGMIDDWLQTDSDLYNDKSGAYTAWTYVRTIANTFLIILFGIIIFSQLTGVGIDNYGIKKILPKLIVMAVLINLSFLICQLAIDLSNIIGKGIQGLFIGIGNGIIASSGDNSSVAIETMNSFVEGLVATVYATVGGSSVIISAAAAAYQGGTVMAVVLVLLMLITIVVAVLVFFISLGARTVIIIMCAVLSPIAFACYILPNTKPVYKKWFDAMKAALIIFPICGAVMGVSYIIKAIAVTTKMNLAFVVIAGIAPYLPFFMIPSMLKGAIGALGTMGAALSTIGSTFRRGAGQYSSAGSNAVKNSERYKNQMRLRGERRVNRRAGIDEKTGHLTKSGLRRARFANSKIGRLFGEDRLQAARISSAKGNLKTSQEANAALTGAVADVEISGAEAAAGFNAGTREAYYASQYLEAARSNNVNEMKSAIVALNNSGMKAKDVAKVIRFAENNGYHSGMTTTTKNAFLRDMANNRDNQAFLSTDFELSHFASSGGTNNHGNLGGLGEYARSAPINIEDIKPEDVLKLSGDSLAAMLSAGTINQGMAQRIMAMNPNMSADKRIMLGAAASGVNLNGTDVAQLKKDASELSQNANAATSVLKVSSSDVAQWTAPTSQRVTVTQEFFGDDRQQRPVDVAVQGESFQVQDNSSTVGSVGSARAANQYEASSQPTVGSARAQEGPTPTRLTPQGTVGSARANSNPGPTGSAPQGVVGSARKRE